MLKNRLNLRLKKPKNGYHFKTKTEKKIKEKGEKRKTKQGLHEK